jgi:hypothetical protein
MSTSDSGEVSSEFLYIPGDFGDLLPVTRRACFGMRLFYVLCHLLMDGQAEWATFI